MAISVNFGHTDRDLRWLDKNPEWTAEEVSCDVYEPVDRLNVQLLVDKNQIGLPQTNYMYIPEFGRYYYITGITGMPGNRVLVAGHVDVLMTYDHEIRNCKCIAERSTDRYNFYLHDGRRLFNSYVYNQYVEFPDLGVPDTCILITLG